MKNSENIKREQNQVNGTLTWDVYDKISNKSQKVTFTHTRHSQQRSCERSIHDQDLAAVIENGDAIFKQGMTFYVLGEKNIPKDLPLKLQKKVKNLVVVVAGDEASIITCYRSKNPFKHLKRKSKTLLQSHTPAA